MKIINIVEIDSGHILNIYSFPILPLEGSFNKTKNAEKLFLQLISNYMKRSLTKKEEAEYIIRGFDNNGYSVNLVWSEVK